MLMMLPQHDNFVFPQQNTYVGEDAAEHFLDYSQTVADKVFELATECHICNKEFVRIHPHSHNKGETTCELCVDTPGVTRM